MKFTIVLTALFFAFQALAHVEGDMQSLPQQKFAAKKFGFAQAVPTGRIRVQGGQLLNFTKNSPTRQKVLDSYEIIEAVLNSESFKERVINYQHSSGQRRYAANRGMTNEQIYQFLMSGREILGGDATPGEMNFDVRYYYRGWSKVIGYTNPGKNNLININGRFYTGYDLSSVASNLVHEWIHLMGFSHEGGRDLEDVAYAIGRIVGDLAQQYIRQGHLD